MDLPREENITKDLRGGIEILFYIPDPTNLDDIQYGTLSVQIKQSDGSTISRTYDLLAKLNDSPEGQAHLVDLVSLKNFVIAEVEAKVLPL